MDFARKDVRLASGTVSYFVGGSGEPLLYLHPAAGVAISQPIETLAQRYMVYLPITPGFDGTAPHEAVKSMEALADVAASFIDAVIGQRCDVIGTSFGGWEALWLAVKHPDKIDHLVLEAPAGVPAGGKGGLPSDPAALRAKLYAYPDRAPPMTKPMEQLQGNRRMLDHYGAISLVDPAAAGAGRRDQSADLDPDGDEGRDRAARDRAIPQRRDPRLASRLYLRRGACDRIRSAGAAAAHRFVVPRTRRSLYRQLEQHGALGGSHGLTDHRAYRRRYRGHAGADGGAGQDRQSADVLPYARATTEAGSHRHADGGDRPHVDRPQDLCVRWRERAARASQRRPRLSGVAGRSGFLRPPGRVETRSPA